MPVDRLGTAVSRGGRRGGARRLGPSAGHLRVKGVKPKPTWTKRTRTRLTWRAESRRTDAETGPGAAGVRARADRRRRAAAARPRPGGSASPGPAGTCARSSATNAAGAHGRRSSRRRPSGWSGPSIGWPASTRSRTRSISTCSPAPWSSSWRPTSAGSGAWARGCWSDRWAWGSASTWTWSSSSDWPRACSPRRPGTTPSSPTTSGRPPATSCPCGPSSVERQHRQLLAALAGARRQVLCVPRGDLRRNIERVPSRWVLQIASALAGERVVVGRPAGRRARTGSPTSPRSTPASGSMAFPATAQEHRLRALMVQGSTRLSRAGAGRSGRRRAGRRRRGGRRGRRSDRFTRFDGNLAGLALPSPADRVTSATRLERWASCPFAYLMRDVLRGRRGREPRGRAADHPARQGLAGAPGAGGFMRDVLGRPARPTGSRRAVVGGRPGPHGQHRPRRCAPTTRPGPHRPARSSGTRTSRRIIADLRRFLDEDSPTARATGPGRWPPSWPSASRAPISTPSPSSCPTGAPCASGARPTGSTSLPTARCTSSTTRPGKADPYQGPERGQPRCAGAAAPAGRLRPGGPPSPRNARRPGRAEYWFVSARRRVRATRVPGHPRRRWRNRRDPRQSMVDGIEAGVFPHDPTARARAPGWSAPTAIPTAWA